MFKVLKTKLNSVMNAIKNLLYEPEDARNTYCIPCTWVITGRVYVNAPNAELAKAYVRTQRIHPDMEECYCINIEPDTERPILCECGNCGREYIVSRFNTSPKCPHCGNGGNFA